MDSTLAEQLADFLVTYWSVAAGVLAGAALASLIGLLRIKKRVHAAFEAGLVRDTE